MREIVLFVEDRAHQLVVGALLRRLAEEHLVKVSAAQIDGLFFLSFEPWKGAST